jgi:hypothetical protein
MKKLLPAHRTRHRVVISVVAATLCLIVGVAQSRALWGLDRGPREQALLATVQVIVADENGNPFSSGSGTVLDAEQGYILTNFHVLGDTETGDLFNEEGLAIIGVNPPNLRSVPVFKYYARMIHGDPEIDLALLQVVSPFDNPTGRLPSNLGLTAAPRGESGALLIGDPIYVLGFPGLGGDTITFTSGTVSGYLDEDKDGTEEWIKTDAEVNHGNSGGLAVDDRGAFIGVPSAGFTDAEAAGKISLIRPGDMALRYYDAWTVGSAVPMANSTPQIGRVTYGTAIRRDGVVRAVASRFASGVSAIYASIDYRNLPRGQALTYRWYRDGVELERGSLLRGDSETGSDWISLSADSQAPESQSGVTGLADGFYELELWLGGRQLYRGGVSVGQAAGNGETLVQLGPITFAEGVQENGTPIRPATNFANVNEVYAIFPAEGLRNGVVLRSVWSYGGTEVLREEWAWDQGDVRTAWLSITHAEGLPVGDYMLDLFVEGKPAQSGVFRVTEQAMRIRDSVNVIGTVHDADNSRSPIEGALIVLLKPGMTVDGWIEASFDETQIYASGTSTRAGAYQLDTRVETGQSYAVIVVHDDYLPVREDAFQAPPDAADPFVLDVPMERR